MIYLDNNTFQQEIFIPRSSVKNDASPEYATKNELENAIENEVIRADEKYAAKTDLLPYATTGWVESQDFATKEWTDGQIQSAIASETGRTEETYQKKSEMGIYSTTNEVENMINGAVSGKMDTSAMSAYTKTEDFATINGSAITSGGNIVIEGGGSDYSAGSNINIDENNVISVTGITVPTSNTAFTNDAGYVTSGEVESQITGKNYATENWVQDNVNLAIESETARTESTYAKIGDIPSLDGYATTGWVESQGYLTEHQDISGKLDTSVFTAYTANTQTELSNKQDISGMTEYATTAFTENTYLKEHQSLSAYSTTEQVQTLINTAKQEVENEIPDVSNFVTSAQVNTQIESKGYITGYTETDPVFMASAASGITSQDITNWNAKLDSSDLEPYYTSAQTDNAISNAVSGKADLSAVTAQISEVKAQIEAEIPTKVSDLQNDLNFVNSGDVKTQVESYNYINSIQAQTQIDNSISGKLDTDIFTAYTANTKTEIDNAVSGKVDSSRVDEIEEVTASALVELHSTKQDILVSGTNIKTINNESILGSGNIVIQGGSGSDYSAGANIDITNNVISVTGITVPTKLSELTNDEGFVNSGEVETQITSKGYITAYTETDPVFQASAASGISAQDINNWNNKLDSSALTPYYTSAQTDTAISNATSGKQDTLVSGTNIKTINNESLLGSGNIVIQGGSGSDYSAGNGIGITNNIISVTGDYETVIELTQEQYDALTSYDENTSYVITNAPAADLSNYYTSAETDTAISNAVSGKTDKVSVTASSSGYKFPTWNNQGCITGTYSNAYQASQSINGSSRTLYSNSSEALPTIYAPTSAGSAGQPLLSNGSDAPVWGSYKFAFITKAQYDQLTPDETTIYFIVG